jgi:tetratricopeptide (TPR) repeat protein
VVSVGSFADPSFPPPTESGYDFRRHPWIGLPESLEQDEGREAWALVHPLYEAGRYAEAADRGREVLEEIPHPRVLYNVACCESLAGRTDDALDHLRRAIEAWGGFRELAEHDPDFEPIRGEPAFEQLVSR